MIYFTFVANCFTMALGFYLVYDGQFLFSVICFLVSFIGFRQVCIELDKKPKKKKKLKPKKKPSSKMSLEAQIRLNKFSLN